MWFVASTPAQAESLEAFTEPYKRVAIPASEVGVISRIAVAEGEEIASGQLLAKLDDRVLQASLAVAKAAMEAVGARQTAETEMKIREKQFESYRELQQRGNATRRELDRAESDYHQAASRLQSVLEELQVRRLEYERVKAQIAQRTITSPIDGHVVAIEKEVGEFVSPTDAVIMSVVHLDTLKAVFSVPLDAGRDLRPDQVVRLQVGSDSHECQGVIEVVSPVADAESSTIPVTVRIPNRGRKIPQRRPVPLGHEHHVARRKDQPAHAADRPLNIC